jgi:hypothetical protein
MVLSFYGAGGRSTLKCRPADSQSGALIDHIKSFETTTDPELVNARDNV